MSWKQIAADRRAAVYESIPAEWRITVPSPLPKNLLSLPAKYLSAEEVEIVSVTANTVLVNIRTGKWTSEQVTRAICHSAAVAHQLCNCLTDFFPEEAIARAKELDANKSSAKGKLYGLPISLKDCVDLKGKDSAIGFIGLLGNPRQEDAKLVKLLYEQGAVFYCKTNVPTSMLMAETDNNLMGRCNNPHNITLTPGGSSGGEGALILLKVSFFGVGTDM